MYPVTGAFSTSTTFVNRLQRYELMPTYTSIVHLIPLFQDFSNPLLRPHLRLYPEKSEKITETWQASKWMTDLPPSLQSPMVIGRGSQHFYLSELAFTDTHQFVIPKLWYTQGGELRGDCWLVSEVVSMYLTLPIIICWFVMSLGRSFQSWPYRYCQHPSFRLSIMFSEVTREVSQW